MLYEGQASVSSAVDPPQGDLRRHRRQQGANNFLSLRFGLLPGMWAPFPNLVKQARRRDSGLHAT